MSTSEAITRLTLDPDNARNTTITWEDGTVAYTVQTEMSDQGTTMRICKAGGSPVAIIQLRARGSPFNLVSVALGDQEPIAIGKWLSTSMVPFRNHASFKDDSGRKYKWKGTGPGESLQLFAEDDDYKECIARFYYSSKSWKTDPPTTIPATLTLLPRAEEIHDLVVASFLFLERERRVKEAATNIRAEVNVLAGMQASMCINTTC